MTIETAAFLSPRDRYEELLRKCPELKEYECDKCAGDLRSGIVHPLWIPAALGCMTMNRRNRDEHGVDHDAHKWVRSRFLDFFGDDLPAAEALVD